MKGYGYRDDDIITEEQMSPDQMFSEIVYWYENACQLRYITGIDTEDGQQVFINVVSQFENDQEEDEEDN